MSVPVTAKPAKELSESQRKALINLLGDDDPDTAVGKQQARGHADQAAADDQDITVVIHESRLTIT